MEDGKHMINLKEFFKKDSVKKAAKTTGTVILPGVALFVLGYYGLKTSKDPDYVDYIKED